MQRPTAVLVALTVAVLVTTGCSSSSPARRRASAPSAPAGAGGGAAEPSESPEATATPTPDATPTNPPTTKPPPKKNPPTGPRPPAGGSGPAGSTIVTGSNAVALTFDDGPDPNFTPRFLDLLKEQGVKATFCLVGFRAAQFPDLVRRIVAEGHTLCNHSWRHRFELGRLSPSEMELDLKRTNEAIHAAVPGAPIVYFRCPGGNFTAPLVAMARNMFGMKSIYWAVDPRDWEKAKFGSGPSMVNHIVSVVKTARPGSIVLSHDLAKPDTLAAYQQLLPWLKARFTLIALPT